MSRKHRWKKNKYSSNQVNVNDINSSTQESENTQVADENSSQPIQDNQVTEEQLRESDNEYAEAQISNEPEPQSVEDNYNSNISEDSNTTADTANPENSDSTSNIDFVYTDDEVPSKKSAIFAIVAGVIIIIAGLFIYNYFSQNQSNNGKVDDKAKKTVAVIKPEIKVDDTSKVIETKPVELVLGSDSEGIVQISGLDARRLAQNANQNSPESISPDDIKTPRSQVTVATANLADAGSQNQNQPNTDENSDSSNTSGWEANDYKQGDIKGSTHNVVSGDTLWEIAEGAYGDGAQWHKIADANNVSYNSLGNPLIFPGQTLTLPT